MLPEDIVSGILTDDQPSILALYDGIWKNRNILSRRGGRALDPEDQAQELFVASWGAIRLGRMETPAALWAWVDTIRYRINCRAMRARVVFVDFEIAARLAAVSERTDALLLDHERTDQIRQVMHALMESDRRILEMFIQEGRTAVEMQAELHLNRAQFALKKSRALQRFRRLLNELRKGAPCTHNIPST